MHRDQKGQEERPPNSKPENIKKGEKGHRQGMGRQGWYINVEKETWDLIIISGLRNMQYEADNAAQVDQSVANSNNEDKPIADMMFRVELTLQQAAFLGKLLPTRYSLQFENKPLKRAASSQKNIKADPVPNDPRRKNSKKDPKPPAKLTTNSSVRSNRYEEPDAIYEKYAVAKEPKRNAFEGVSQALKPCVRILNLLKNSRTSWPFREPVDPVALGIPQYIEIIKEPMDLSTIENNLRANLYVTPTQFHADVAKIINNSFKFNSANAEFTKITSEFQAYYNKITADPLESSVRSTIDGESRGGGQPREKKVSREASGEWAGNISMEEKKKLSNNIKKLPREAMKGILDIVNEGKTKNTGEFDLKDLEPQVIRKLQVYVTDKLAEEARRADPTRQTAMNGQDPNEESSFQVDEDEDS